MIKKQPLYRNHIVTARKRKPSKKKDKLKLCPTCGLVFEVVKSGRSFGAKHLRKDWPKFGLEKVECGCKSRIE